MCCLKGCEWHRLFELPQQIIPKHPHPRHPDTFFLDHPGAGSPHLRGNRVERAIQGNCGGVESPQPLSKDAIRYFRRRCGRRRGVVRPGGFDREKFSKVGTFAVALRPDARIRISNSVARVYPNPRRYYGVIPGGNSLEMIEIGGEWFFTGKVNID